MGSTEQIAGDDDAPHAQNVRQYTLHALYVDGAASGTIEANDINGRA